MSNDTLRTLARAVDNYLAGPAPAGELAEALARYDALTLAERQRAARLVMATGCTLGLAVSAVEALRPTVEGE